MYYLVDKLKVNISKSHVVPQQTKGKAKMNITKQIGFEGVN